MLNQSLSFIKLALNITYKSIDWCLLYVTGEMPLTPDKSSWAYQDLVHGVHGFYSLECSLMHSTQSLCQFFSWRSAWLWTKGFHKLDTCILSALWGFLWSHKWRALLLYTSTNSINTFFVVVLFHIVPEVNHLVRLLAPSKCWICVKLLKCFIALGMMKRTRRF